MPIKNVEHSKYIGFSIETMKPSESEREIEEKRVNSEENETQHKKERDSAKKNCLIFTAT